MAFCTDCGTAFVDGATFCRTCGRRRNPEAQPTSQNFCVQCGLPVSVGNRFCNGCGSPLGEPLPDVGSAHSQTVGPAPALADRPPRPSGREVFKSVNNKWSTWVVVGVAALAVIVPLSTWAMSGTRPKPKARVVAAKPVPSDPVATSSSLLVGPVECTNSRHGFTITVPRSWADNTAQNRDCTSFFVPLGEPGREAGLVVSPSGNETVDQVTLQGKVTKKRRGYVGGKAANYYESTQELSGHQYSIFTYIVDRAGEAFGIQLMAFSDIPITEATKKQFDEVVRQLKFAF